MIEKFRVTLAHRDTLGILKGYPTVIEPNDLLFSSDGTAIAVDGKGHEMYPSNNVTTPYFGIGRFGQSSMAIEAETSNKITDSAFLDTVNFGTNWSTVPGGGTIDENDIYKPANFAGTTEKTLRNDGFGAQVAKSYSQNFISGVIAGDTIVQSCWVSTDATAIRFSIYSTETGHNYDNYITIPGGNWFFVESAPYTIKPSDLASGGQIRQFHIETSADATKLLIFHPQIELHEFATSWTSGTRNEGILSYSNSYFSPDSFTIGGWFYIKNFDGPRNALFSICNDYNALYRLVAFTDNINNNKIIVQGADHTNQLFNINSSYNVGTGAWFHVMMTYDGINYKLYINGIQDDDITESRKLQFRASSQFYIGTWFEEDFINGYINDIIISSRVFDDALIEHLYINEMPLYNPYYYVGQV